MREGMEEWVGIEPDATGTPATDLTIPGLTFSPLS